MRNKRVVQSRNHLANQRPEIGKACRGLHGHAGTGNEEHLARGVCQKEALRQLRQALSKADAMIAARRSG